MDPEIGTVQAPQTVRIGEWLVEPSLNRLSRGETVVQLRPKAMDVLALLASRPGQVVPRETILEVVWARKFIADSALASAISELRKALGDDPLTPDLPRDDPEARDTGSWRRSFRPSLGPLLSPSRLPAHQRAPRS